MSSTRAADEHEPQEMRGRKNPVQSNIQIVPNADALCRTAAAEVVSSAKAAVLKGRYAPSQLPAQLIQPHHGQLLWLVDQAAAHLLQRD